MPIALSSRMRPHFYNCHTVPRSRGVARSDWSPFPLLHTCVSAARLPTPHLQGDPSPPNGAPWGQRPLTRSREIFSVCSRCLWTADRVFSHEHHPSVTEIAGTTSRYNSMPKSVDSDETIHRMARGRTHHNPTDEFPIDS